MKIDDYTKAWLAGFIDGEGYIGIVRQRKKPGKYNSATWQYHPWIIITGTDKDIIDDLCIVLDAKRASLSPTAGHKIGYQAKITNFASLRKLIEWITPFLRIKNQQAILLLKFIDYRENSIIVTGRKSYGNSSFGIDEENIYLELRKLNKRGV